MAEVKDFYYKHNRLQQLRGFCYAAQYGSISKAATKMNLTHSSVSLQIKALEDDFGCTFFIRTGPRIELTEDGKKLLAMALPLVDGIHELKEVFHHETKVRKQDELHIALNASSKNFLMPPILREYIKTHPTTRVILHYYEHPESMELLNNGKVDIAILARHDHMPFPQTCEYIPVFYCKTCLITPHDHPLAGRKNLLVSEISRYPLVLPTKEMQIIPNLRETFGLDAKSNAPIDFINSDTFREYIEAGLVITIAPDVWMREERDSLVATDLSHLFPDTDYGLVRMRNKPMPKKVSDLLKIMRSHATKREVREKKLVVA